MLEFKKFPKIGRMRRDCCITEKIDGTNAQIQFDEEGNMLVGSRKRQIWPEGTTVKHIGCRLVKVKGTDNMGFAGWAYEHQAELFEFLGEGRHYGEWCGGKIQRGYGMTEKKFLLFAVNRFGEGRQEIPQSLQDIGLGVVPTLYEGEFTTNVVDSVMALLKLEGSKLNGFDNPEGVVVFHSGTGHYFKVTFEHDYAGKGLDNQSPD